MSSEPIPGLALTIRNILKTMLGRDKESLAYVESLTQEQIYEVAPNDVIAEVARFRPTDRSSFVQWERFKTAADQRLTRPVLNEWARQLRDAMPQLQEVG